MFTSKSLTGAAKGVPMKVLWSLTLGIVLTALVVGCAVATAIPTLTAEESLQQFVLCDRLVAKKSMFWGQAPGVIYSGNPHITGMIEPGDYVRFLMSSPNADGVIQIKVFPHDERVVGKTNNQVWINWVGLLRFRSDRDVFTCEDTSAGAAPTVEAAPTPTVETAAEASVATAIPTLTAEESLLQFVRCYGLLAKKSMLWGQAPAVIYSGNPHITGMIEPGDYVRFLMSRPNADGVIQIKVFPHDERVVGKTNNEVWIDWVELTRYRSDREMFTCED